VGNSNQESVKSPAGTYYCCMAEPENNAYLELVRLRREDNKQFLGSLCLPALPAAVPVTRTRKANRLEVVAGPDRVLRSTTISGKMSTEEEPDSTCFLPKQIEKWTLEEAATILGRRFSAETGLAEYIRQNRFDGRALLSLHSLTLVKDCFPKFSMGMQVQLSALLQPREERSKHSSHSSPAKKLRKRKTLNSNSGNFRVLFLLFFMVMRLMRP